MWYWLKRRVHATWHVTAVCCGIVLGVFAARWWNGFDEHIWWVVIGPLVIGALVARWRVMLAISLVAGLMIGNWRGSVVHYELEHYRSVIGKSIELRGVVVGDSELGANGGVVVKLREDTHGGVWWVTLRGDDASQIARGDHLSLHGEASEGFGTFAAAMYGAKLTGISRVKNGDPALTLRNGFSRHVQEVISDPAASLGIGYLLGQKQALGQQLQEAMVITGLTHVVVASGYNLTILVRMARRLFAKISKYLAALSSVVMVGIFIAVTGMSPSMSRAGLVAMLAIWAWYYGRKFHPVTLLLLAASVTLLWNPSYGWGDIGWLLSFAAFGGVMIVAPLLQAYFFGTEKPRFLAQVAVETVSAQLVTAPIIIAVFGQFSNIALLANVLIVPFIPIAMLLTFVAGLGAWVVPMLAHVIAWPAQTILDIMIWVVAWAAEVPGAQSEIVLPWWGIALWYGGIVAACWYCKRQTGYRLREASIVE